VHPPAKEPRPRRLHHRHSIVDNPEWFYSETEQDISDPASNKHWLHSPAAIPDDRPDLQLRDHLRNLSHFKQPGSQAATSQSSSVHSSSYNAKFDWKQWYHQQVDSSDDEQY